MMMLREWNIMLITDNEFDLIKEEINSLGSIKVENPKELISFEKSINDKIKLRILVKNIRNSRTVGIGIDEKGRIKSISVKNKDPEMNYNNLINMKKLTDMIIDDLFTDIRLKLLTDTVKSNAFTFIGKHFPQHRKSLIQFNIIESKDCRTLDVCYDKQRNEIQLRYNPINYSRIILSEVFILWMKSDRPDTFKSENLNNLIIVYGAFLFLHELYHVLHRHIFNDNKNENIVIDKTYENMIMDEYINTKLIYDRLNISEVKDYLSVLNLEYLEINTGIDDTLDSINYINNDLVKSDRISIDNVLQSFSEMFLFSYEPLERFLAKCEFNDSLFISIQNISINDAYDKFSYLTRKFIFEFTSNKSMKSLDKSETNSENDGDTDVEDKTNKGSEENSKNKNTGTSSDNSEESDGKSSSSNEKLKDDNNFIDSESFKEEEHNIESEQDYSDLPNEMVDSIIKGMVIEICNTLNDRNSLDKSLLDLIKDIDNLDSITIREDWKDRLYNMIVNATGIEFVYNPDGQNRRYENQLGRLEIVPALENIILSFDISGSMKTEDYRIAIDYLNDLLKHLQSGEFNVDSSVGIGYIFWAGTFNGYEYTVNIKPVSYTNIFESIKSYELNARKTVGLGTDFGAFIRPFVSGKFKGLVPDLMIIFTDGQFLSLGHDEEENKKYLNWYRQNSDKILFILTTDEYLDCIAQYDLTYKLKTIVFKK